MEAVGAALFAGIPAAEVDGVLIKMRPICAKLVLAKMLFPVINEFCDFVGIAILDHKGDMGDGTLGIERFS